MAAQSAARVASAAWRSLPRFDISCFDWHSARRESLSARAAAFSLVSSRGGFSDERAVPLAAEPESDVAVAVAAGEAAPASPLPLPPFGS